MIAVLLVLMALFVLCAPFLLTVRNADRASTQAAERAAGRLALDAAARHARAQLEGSHATLDPTPYFDSEEELEVESTFAADFLDPRDPGGVMWDLDVRDDAGRVDLGSASPGVLANLLGLAARLTAPVEDDGTVLEVTAAGGFPDSGIAWLDAELLGYGARKNSSLENLVRGLGVRTDADGAPLPCGPAPASGHELGAYVIDQSAFAIPLWRIRSREDGRFARLDAIEQAARAVQYSISGTLSPNFLSILERTTSAQGDVGAGPTWVHGSALTGPITGEPGEGCLLPVEDARHFNRWTTVRISNGRVSEYGIVRASNAKRIRLMDPLGYDGFEPYETVIEPLARRPVNVNTASPEVLRALFLNLRLRGKSSRITEREADELVNVVVVSRPFDGFEDFLRRVVLPAAGWKALPPDAPVVPEVFAQSGAGDGEEGGPPPGFLDEDDARALYRNALDANDAELDFSTMPFSFTSRDVYRMDLRAAVNAPSGVERSRAGREEVDLIVPQDELLRLWARQEDFDDEPRLDGEAPFWMSGPEATTRFDRWFKSPWPPRARAHLGPFDVRVPAGGSGAQTGAGQGDAEPDLTFPSREDDVAWIQLAPSREPDFQGGSVAGRVLHFDDEPKGLEGLDLATRTLRGAPGEFGWTGGNMGPVTFRGWIRPRSLVDGDRYLDLGGNFTDSDRISLLVEDGDLVLRVLDAMGDHPATSFKEVSEVRYSLTEGPGLGVDQWAHVDLQVSGNRPDQMHLFVDGRDSARTPGLTRLTANLNSAATRIPVESTEGFPERCVLRIGNELIEAIVEGKTSFRCVHESNGPNAGFGGRLARERYTAAPQQNMGVQGKDTDHPRGAAVQLYGYSLPLLTNVPSSSGRLTDALGGFAVGRVVTLVRNGNEEGDPITATDPNVPGISYRLGTGLSGETNAGVSIRIAAADPNRDIGEVMSAFSRDGGYAALLSRIYTLRTTPGAAAAGGEVSGDVNGYRIGGVEVIRYASVQGDQLLISGRGIGAPELPRLPTPGRASPGKLDVGGRSSFIFDWSKSDLSDAAERSRDLTEQVLVIPISVGVGSTSSFNPPGGNSEFAQITRLGTDAGRTEWIRYDDIAPGGLLVRSAPDALRAANLAAHGGVGVGTGQLDRPNGPGPGPGSGGGGPRLDPPRSYALATRPTPGPKPRAPLQGGNAFWHFALGEPEFEVEANPVTRAVASQFQFRGVLGTYSHDHPAGTVVLPVFQTVDEDETAGFPGRFDRVAFADRDSTTPVFYATVLHAHRPLEHTAYGYRIDESAEFGALDAGTEVAEPESGMRTNVIYVALEEPLPVPFAPSAIQGRVVDTRTVTRMMAYPSGELPRAVGAVAVGGDVRSGGRSGAAVPSAVVDELSFAAANPAEQFIVLGGDLQSTRTSLSEDGDVLQTYGAIRATGADVRVLTPLNRLPNDAGLLRIGDEVLCYDSYDAKSGVVHLSPGGRGLLGTDPAAHARGESITFLSGWTVTDLASPLSADSAEIPLGSPDGFPSSGLVRIDDELIHYTSLQGGTLRMPRFSDEPGMRDGKGAGIFRGRFGTRPVAHAVGTPVILFPFRYWDRAPERADDPALAYYQFDLDQPGALWKKVFWDVEAPAAGGVRLEVLQRTDPSVPWDADPDTTPGLTLLNRGRIESGGNSIGVQADRVEWRVFARFDLGAFDPIAGLSHGWKATPRLVLFGTEYLAPSRVLRRVER
ncbi:MAG TPA: hypothetical protein ENJ09_09180 [Planctomycetes bacterium]|nr:hypothetical protein [Planctomycetota bacterium]